MDRVDYVDTFIAVADDSRVTKGAPPPVKTDSPSVAARTYQMIAEHPYEFTSGDVIFTVFADHHQIPEQERPAARVAFYSKGQHELLGHSDVKNYDGSWTEYGSLVGALIELGSGTKG